MKSLFRHAKLMMVLCRLIQIKKKSAICQMFRFKIIILQILVVIFKKDVYLILTALYF